MDESGAPPASAPAPMQPPRRALRKLALVLLAVPALLAALVAAIGWSARSERGSAWLLSVLPGVQVEAPKGEIGRAHV